MKQQAAFTLLEVLIAVFILAVGLLGLAGLQTMGMRNNNSAYLRSQATVLADDIADRIRANRDTDYTSVAAATVSACLTTAGCDPDDMAKNDLKEWQDAVAAALPSGTGTLSLSSNVYTVTIQWDDSFSGNAAQVGNSSQQFTTRFQP